MSPNRLAKEKSPYLLQHKDNPVDWYPWGPEAFEKARKEEKLIFLSIGYATCHWCHVMEHDSFEKEDVARLLNSHFVPIKVDREERPDVDQLYMDAVMSLTGSGGWPMSVFLTPELKPFFGGTFFWKDQFLHLLNQVRGLWTDNRGQLLDGAEEVVRHLSSRPAPSGGFPLDDSILAKAYRGYWQSFDETNGGFGNAPKFPRSTDLSLLLRLHRRSGEAHALNMAEMTLDKMARGGIYDHLGGGFHRYATDARRLTPHFEKMLYDNALLAYTYLEAYQATKKPLYAAVARETLDYVLRDMTSKEGGFYSAEDADSEGEEGKFYVWEEKELKALLSDEEFKKVSAVYGVTPNGNFEHQTNILNLQKTFEWSVKEDPLIASAHAKLLEVRKRRIRPLLDDKVLTSWNGLMIRAMAKGALVLKEEMYKKAAEAAAGFIRERLYKEDVLWHRYREGEASVSGLLEDYAYLISGLIPLFEATGDETWLKWAMALQSKQDDLFWDAHEGAYFLSSAENAELILRNKDGYDGVTPSGNSVSAHNLLLFLTMTGKAAYRDKFEALKKYLAPLVYRHAPGYSHFLCALDASIDGVKEIVVFGPEAERLKMVSEISGHFIPNQVLISVGPGETVRSLPAVASRGEQGGDVKVFVCSGTTCGLPGSSLEVIEKELLHFNPLPLP